MFWEYIEYEGAIDDIAALVARLPKDAAILFSAPGLSTRLGVPMTYIYGLDVYPVPKEFYHDGRLRDLVAIWQQRGRPVYWLDRFCEPLEDYHPIWLDSEEFYEWPYVPALIDQLPNSIAETSYRLCAYRLGGCSTENVIPENLNLNYGDQITLLGYEFSGKQVRPGDNVYLHLYWQAEHPLTTDYKVFVHILDDAQQQLWGQKDHTPADDSRPTSGWEVGEVIVDTVIVPLQPDVPPGQYRLQVGLYDFDTLERLQILDETQHTVGDHVVLESIKVIIPSENE